MLADKTAPGQTESLSFEFDLPHAPEKVWRALTEPALLAEWLLPVIGFDLAPGHIALDSGCVWGRQLTAVRLPDRTVFQIKAVESAS